MENACTAVQRSPAFGRRRTVEETGSISVTHNGRMIRRLDQSRLQNILMAFYRPRTTRNIPEWLQNILNRLRLPQSADGGG